MVNLEDIIPTTQTRRHWMQFREATKAMTKKFENVKVKFLTEVYLYGPISYITNNLSNCVYIPCKIMHLPERVFRTLLL